MAGGDKRASPYAQSSGGKRPRAAGTEDSQEASQEADDHDDIMFDVDEAMEDEMAMDAEREADEEAARGAPPVADDEGLSSSTGTHAAKWPRPPVAADMDPGKKPLIFQWVDIDMAAGEPLKVDPLTGKVPAVGAKDLLVPIIRITGVTPEGHSVFAHVHGFTPYLLVPAPTGFTQEKVAALRKALDLKLRSSARGADQRLKNLCLGVSFTDERQSILGYHFGKTRKFLQIFVAMPSLVVKAKSAFHEGIRVGAEEVRIGTTYESNVPFVLRFMVDKEISGVNWLELPAGSYSLRGAKGKLSRCQLEADVCFPSIISHAPEKEWNKIAPLRILSFDIECAGRKGCFPEAELDPVIQIANYVKIQGTDIVLAKNVFTLKGCSPIAGSHVMSSDTEAEMLMKWSAFVRAIDPDLITGYNVQNFDVPYLLNRAAALKKKHPILAGFGEWGRMLNARCTMKDTTFQSSAFGKRENVETTIHGRVLLDMMPYMFRNHKLSSYSLNSVSAEFLGQQKEDVHHSIISDLQGGDDDDRRRLAVYCIKDAELPLLLMDKLSVVVNTIEMARVTGVPLNFILARGQQIKVFSMLLRKTKSEGLVIPNLQKHGGDNESYEGATVIDPKKAFYEEPVATLDFASLYPSIMQAYNLCYSTLVAAGDVGKLKPDEYLKSPSNDCFVKSTTRKGILPVILDELLSARKQAKRDMAKATDPMEKAVQNGRQLALKISANSVYGYTGATVGQLPCLPIASSVTAYGRELLFKTREYVEQHYTKDNGYPADADVVYGDTDSVMVKFGVKTVAEAMPLAEKAAEEVSAIFPRPIKLEFEKVYWPYLLMNKKRYAGLLWTKAESFDKMDTKGLETVRRDNCLLVRQVVDTCLRKILIDRDTKGAISYTKAVIAELLQNKMDISLLVITKALAKSADDEGYANRQAHVELAMRMRKRDPGTAPNVGDRVAYVITKGVKNAPAYDKAEDPVYVLENNIPIDTDHYLSNQLKKPLERLFEPIISDTNDLFKGDHTLKISSLTPTAKPGGIMMFAVKKLTCISCKSPISEKERTLCVYCRPKEAVIYSDKLKAVNEAEVAFSRLWTQCQDCQGSCHQDVLCTNKDCAIFYRRKKVQKDLTEAQGVVDRFSW